MDSESHGAFESKRSRARWHRSILFSALAHVGVLLICLAILQHPEPPKLAMESSAPQTRTIRIVPKPVEPLPTATPEPTPPPTPQPTPTPIPKPTPEPKPVLSKESQEPKAEAATPSPTPRPTVKPIPAATPKPKASPRSEPISRKAPTSSASTPDTPPSLIRNPAPPYPRTAKRDALEGEVLLRLSIDANGRVTNASIIRSSGHAVLDQAATRGVKRWRFQPAKLRGKSVPSTVNVPVNFALR